MWRRVFFLFLWRKWHLLRTSHISNDNIIFYRLLFCTKLLLLHLVKVLCMHALCHIWLAFSHSQIPFDIQIHIEKVATNLSWIQLMAEWERICSRCIIVARRRKTTKIDCVVVCSPTMLQCRRCLGLPAYVDFASLARTLFSFNASKNKIIHRTDKNTFWAQSLHSTWIHLINYFTSFLSHTLTIYVCITCDVSVTAAAAAAVAGATVERRRKKGFI